MCLWHFRSVSLAPLFQVLAAASFVRPPSIEFFEDLPWDFSSEFPEVLHPSALVPDTSSLPFCWVLPSHQVAAFLTMPISYLSYLSLVSLVLVWKSWSIFSWVNLEPSPRWFSWSLLSYKAWWRRYQEDSLPKIVFSEKQP